MSEIDEEQEESIELYREELFENQPLIHMYPSEARGHGSFVPDANTMYYVLHIMDTEMAQVDRFVKNAPQWHPYVSRLYFGIIFGIQTLRCMQAMVKLGRKNSSFLKSFLAAYPLKSLHIPGPLMPFFSRLCISKNRYGAEIYPTLPKEKQLYPRHCDGCPKLTPASWLIPNVPELIALIGRISDIDLAKCDPFKKPTLLNPVCTYSYEESIQDHLNPWYFCTPGLGFKPEIGRDKAERFISNACSLELPTIDQKEINSVSSYMGLDQMDWFATLRRVMRDYAECFKCSGTLADCPEFGEAASQVVCRRLELDPHYPPPKFIGDNYQPACKFEAFTHNMDLSEEESMIGIYTQLNTLYWEDHPYIDHSQIPSPLKSGPFWSSCYHRKVVEGIYLHQLGIERAIRNRFLSEPDEENNLDSPMSS